MDKNRLAERLKQLRIAHSYNQEYVASFLGVIRQTYSHYETGRCKPSSDTLYKLAGLYNNSVEDLMHLSVNLDKDIYYDAPAPSNSSEELKGYLSFFNEDFNRKKYRFFTDTEKELLYYFSLLGESDKKEIIEITKLKVRLL